MAPKIQHFSMGIHSIIKRQYYPVRNSDPTVRAGYATTSIRIYNILGQTIAQMNSDGNGNYSITYSVAYGTYYLDIPLQNSWIQLRDANNNLIRHTFAFTPAPIIRYNYDWAAGDASNVRYHASRIHDFYRNAPFNYTGMDYQMIARVGFGADVSGAADGRDMRFGSQGGQLWARSSDVVYHEYTHNTIYRIYSGWIGNPNEPLTQASAMDEGLSDYFAGSINNDPILGEDVAVNRTLSNTFQWTDGWNAHQNGQVIGGAVWRTRQSIGNQTIGDNLAFKALQVVPRARNFSNYLYNMMVADNGTYNAAYRTHIRNAFAVHGITTTEPPWPGPSNLTHTGQQGQSPTLQWQYTEPPNFGFTYFRVYRRASGGVAEVIATPTTTSYTDHQVVVGGPEIQNIFEYYVTASSQSNGESSASNTVTVNGQPMLKRAPDVAVKIVALPERFALSQNYPNPFNPQTAIRFALPEPSTVRLTVLDVLGREVAVLVDRLLPAGHRTARWNGRNAKGEPVGSGVYFYRITALGESGKTFSQTMKMLVAK
jgi:hypothetical protein